MKFKRTKLITALTFAISYGFSGISIASESIVELATAKGCFTCHSIAPDKNVKKPLAPSYQDIASRYRGDKSAEAMLVERIISGTVNQKQNWEGMLNMRFMPPNVNTSRAEATELVKGILTLEGDAPISAEIKEHEKMLAFATTNSCMTCHNMSPLPKDVRAVPLAPSLREVAAYYEGNEEAKAHLISSVKSGTMGKPKTWLNVNMEYMPANIALRDEDVERFVDWILKLDHTGIQAPKFKKGE